MEKLHLDKSNKITIKDGCDKYLEYCKLRNLREGTIKHYRQSILWFRKYLDMNMLVIDFNERVYKNCVLVLKEKLNNDVSINSYLRDLITIVHYWMDNNWIPRFKMSAIKVDKRNIETYSEEELEKILKKPDISKSSFIQYQCWVMSSFLFSTGVRQRSLINIQIKDVDFENNVIYVNVTKNRKPLIVPMSPSLVSVLKEYLKLRPYKNEDEYLFVNVFGNQLCKSTSYHMLYFYNKSRGVETTGLHRYRHTFAKQWILNGGNVVALSKLLGHSSLQITQNYVNILVSDLVKEVDNINLLGKFEKKEMKKIKINK